MSTAESDVSQAGLSRPGQGESPPGGGAQAGGRGPRRRRWLLGAVSGLVAAALAGAVVLAAAYQPVSFGGIGGGSFAGLPAGTGLRAGYPPGSAVPVITRPAGAA